MKNWCPKCKTVSFSRLKCVCGEPLVDPPPKPGQASYGLGLALGQRPKPPPPPPGAPIDPLVAGLIGGALGFLGSKFIDRFIATHKGAKPAASPAEPEPLLEIAQLALQREHVFMGGACVVCEKAEGLFAVAPGVTVDAALVPCPGPRPRYQRWRIQGDGFPNGPASDIEVVCLPCSANYGASGQGTHHRRGRWFCADCGALCVGRDTERIDRRSEAFLEAEKELQRGAKDYSLSLIARDAKL